MSSFKENFPLHKRKYAAMRSKKNRGAYPDQLCACHGANRKYLIKLLRGKRAYKPRQGRSPAYGEGARDLLVKLRRAAGMPCAEYPKPLLPKLAADYAAPGNAAAPDAPAQALAMSASTIGRSIRRASGGVASAALRRNKRSCATANSAKTRTRSTCCAQSTRACKTRARIIERFGCPRI